MRILLSVLLITSVAIPAFAQQQSETLNLYPKSREAYQARSEERGQQYQAEGYSYIENLYEYRGEGGTSAESRMSEEEADAAIESVDKSDNAPKTDAPPASPAQ